MLEVRKNQERGHFDHGWLDTYHTFSFAEYRDPQHMGFRQLRVINEDRVAPGMGFGTHPHRDMEIITYVLSGALEHKDSLGNGTMIRPGEVQRMTAGAGVTHSEFNPSPSEPVHLLQIWIRPEQKGLQPGYEQKLFSDEDKRNRLRLIASRDGRDGSVVIHQNVGLYAALLEPERQVSHTLAAGRHAWIQVIRGRIDLNGRELEPGDGAAVSDEPQLQITAHEDAELLVFDLN